MSRRNRWLAPALACALWSLPCPAQASRVTFHYAPSQLCGTALKPSGQGGVPGVRTAWFGLYRDAYACTLKPTHMVNFRHPYSNRYVTVPLTLPYDSTPRIEHRSNVILFNYGSYAVETRFLADGSVDVVYNNGFFPFQ